MELLTGEKKSMDRRVFSRGLKVSTVTTELTFAEDSFSVSGQKRPARHELSLSLVKPGTVFKLISPTLPNVGQRMTSLRCACVSQLIKLQSLITLDTKAQTGHLISLLLK